MDRLPVEILFEIIDCEWLFLYRRLLLVPPIKLTMYLRFISSHPTRRSTPSVSVETIPRARPRQYPLETTLLRRIVGQH